MQTLSRKLTHSASPNVSPHRRWWHDFAHTFLTAIFAILILEASFASAGVGEGEYLHPDRELGVNPMAGKCVTYREEGFGRFRYNTLAMQDDERSLRKPVNTKRIACLGDSYVEALQVDRRRNFCQLLERRLNQGHSQRFEVLNFGVSCSSLGQMYLRLKRDVLPFDPDVAIVFVRVDASFQLAPNPDGGFLYARPTFFVGPNGTIIQDNTVQELWRHSREGKRMRATDWLRANSRIWGVVAQAVGQVTAFIQQPRATSEHSIVAAAPVQPSESVREAKRIASDKATAYLWPVADALLREMKQQCDTRHCRMVIVRLPGADNSRNDLETELLKKTAQTYRIPFFDSTREYNQALRSPKKVFYKTHFTPRGHQIMATILMHQRPRLLGL